MVGREPWTANRGVASHARADRIDAVAGRGGEGRHTGAAGRRRGRVARRQAHHERMRDERAREAAAGNAELPPEDDAVDMASAVHVLDSVAEVGPNYTLAAQQARRRRRSGGKKSAPHTTTRKRKETAQTARHRRGLARAVLINSL